MAFVLRFLPSLSIPCDMWKDTCFRSALCKGENQTHYSQGLQGALLSNERQSGMDSPQATIYFLFCGN